MYVGIFPENLALIVFAVLAATLLSGVYPAWKAGRVEPVESSRLV
jgi:ABC-type lipoprotein release transport system permease subunit